MISHVKSPNSCDDVMWNKSESNETATLMPKFNTEFRKKCSHAAWKLQLTNSDFSWCVSSYTYYLYSTRTLHVKQLRLENLECFYLICCFKHKQWNEAVWMKLPVSNTVHLYNRSVISVHLICSVCHHTTLMYPLHQKGFYLFSQSFLGTV